MIVQSLEAALALRSFLLGADATTCPSRQSTALARTKVFQLAERTFGGLAYELILRDKMIVETSVGETRTLHQVHKANTLEAVLAKLIGGSLYHLLLVLVGLLLANPHFVFRYDPALGSDRRSDGRACG
jgi:hypothetical protein